MIFPITGEQIFTYAAEENEQKQKLIQLAGVVEYTNCITAKE